MPFSKIWSILQNRKPLHLPNPIIGRIEINISCPRCSMLVEFMNYECSSGLAWGVHFVVVFRKPLDMSMCVLSSQLKRC
jgi:hypothetical protein